ncbi:MULTISPECIES: hypothetical protein [Pacificimonas]|uniref:Uncharacterized protein n=1 Tax=Pacificimonas aurantium TaxID=1250540 RepID=A0ABS7WJR1_9SPHN|nr:MULTISPECIES: hypothetical protein [Pacificimonas]MBZ6378643.1 hypothetical protein [Pacificimonas aurantium]
MLNETDLSQSAAATTGSQTLKRRPKGIRRPSDTLKSTGALFHAWRA